MSGSVVRSYLCEKEAGGCGQIFQDCKPYHAMFSVQCPYCSMDGTEEFTDSDGIRRHKIAWLPPRIQQIHDLAHADGGTGDAIPMPALGPDVRVRSRAELDDAMKRAREEYWKSTNGPHSTIRPFKDPATGEMTFEKVTTMREGVDLGELHHIDAPEERRPQQSPFDPSLTADEHIRRLDAELGEPAASPTPDQVPRKRGRPRKRQ